MDEERFRKVRSTIEEKVKELVLGLKQN
jgi:hypothetical protein